MPADGKKILVGCRGLSVGYGGRPVLADVDIDLSSSDTVGILGPNGAGKTTLVRTLIGLIPPVAGKCQRIPELKVGYVPQRHALAPLHPFSVFEIAAMGRRLRLDAESSVRPAVERALRETGIWDLRATPFLTLSGGQRQRVLMARALAAEPDLFILDEPTNDLDAASEEAVHTLIGRVHEERSPCTVVISHLLHVVLNLCRTIVFLHAGRAFAHPREELVEKDLLRSRYGLPVRIGLHKNRYFVYQES